ncbi:MAG TPA: DUF58 domain-containing protein [Gaiellaceae bacterium]|nr:DUF58 domain-containing protein [Gaiellaceae bacterium]
MTQTSKTALYATFAAASFLTALVLGRPELAALGAPFAFVLAAGLALRPPRRIEVSLRLPREIAVEGDELEAELELRAGTNSQRVELALLLPEGLHPVEAAGETLALRLGPNEKRAVPIRVECRRWGAYRPEQLVVRCRDLLGLRVRDERITGEDVLRVYPRSERLQRLIAPFETQPFSGNRVARARGEGIEFADVRPYVPGDRARSINWRASALRQTLYVNQQHPERNTDVVIFLDSFAEARRQDESTLDLAVRGAGTLAERYLLARDRVGLVSFGGVLRWLTPATGTRQLYRIVEALLETEVVFSFAWKGVDVLPARSLTPQALVVALTPLLDERSVTTLLDLRARGFDLVVVDITPVGFAGRAHGDEEELAFRFWKLWRDALRFRFERLGVAVVEWDSGQPLAQAIEEVRAFRRYARTASV